MGAQMAEAPKESGFCYCDHRPQYLPPHMVNSDLTPLDLSLPFLFCFLCQLYRMVLTLAFRSICDKLVYEFSSRFHDHVTRCYCPSEEVSKRAMLKGLEPSQIRVFGLPIRPSFCRAVLNKVCLFEGILDLWIYHF